MEDAIDEPVLVGDTPRPRVGAPRLEWLRFPNSTERIALDGRDEVHNPERNPALGCDPVAQILVEGTRVNDRAEPGQSLPPHDRERLSDQAREALAAAICVS